MLKLSKYGLSSKLRGTFSNGILYGFIHGQVFTVDDMADPNLSRMVIEQMTKWHKLCCDPQPKLLSTLNRWVKASKLYLNLVPEAFSKPAYNNLWNNRGLSIQKLSRELQWLQKELELLESPVVFCHNDLLSGNLVYDKDNNRVVFIDYEYGCSSYRGFDIANHFCEYAGFDCEWSKLPTKEYQINWISQYLELMQSDENPETVYNEIQIFTLAAHLYWSVWAFVN